MRDLISLTIRYTPEDYVRAIRFIRYRNPLVKYAFLFPILMFPIIAVVMYFVNPQSMTRVYSQPRNWLIFLIPVLATPLVYFANRHPRNLLMKYQIKKQIASSPVLQQPQTITFDAEGIEGSTSLGSANTRWEAIIEAIETKSDFFLFTAKKIAIFLPKSAFELENDLDDLRMLIKSKVAKFS